jgi:hypothetical protein
MFGVEYHPVNNYANADSRTNLVEIGAYIFESLNSVIRKTIGGIMMVFKISWHCFFHHFLCDNTRKCGNVRTPSGVPKHTRHFPSEIRIIISRIETSSLLKIMSLFACLTFTFIQCTKCQGWCERFIVYKIYGI